MSTISANLRDELDNLANELDGYAVKLTALANESIVCWIEDEKYRGLPFEVDIHRGMFSWKHLEPRDSQPIRVVWLYRDDYQAAPPILTILRELGAVLANLSNSAKTIVYDGWCKHFLPDQNDKISYVVEALLPRPSHFMPPLPHFSKLESLEGVSVNHISGSFIEIYMANLAEAAAYSASALAETLRTDPQPINPPAEGEFCCVVAEEEERRRLKGPEEILPRIHTLKMRWQRMDDYWPSNPQQLIDDL